jgi:menaquinone-dependent protoporphyrinogen oxidase
MSIDHEQENAMKNVLITYATMSGTTADVARTISEELTKKGAKTTLLPLAEVKSLEAYDGVVLGAPMIMGWHRDAMKFLQSHENQLAGKKLALFATAMSLTQTGETAVDGVPVTIDQKLAIAPQKPGKLRFKERFCAITEYARPMIKAAGSNVPASLALFGGRLDMYRLKWWAAAFVLLVIRAKPGEKRNWEAIKAWAGTL